jgi:hypothetical protein
MISAPPDPLGQRKSRSAPVPAEVQAAYAARLSSFVNERWSQVDPHEMTIDPDAVEMLLDFHHRLRGEHDLPPQPVALPRHRINWDSPADVHYRGNAPRTADAFFDFAIKTRRFLAVTGIFVVIVGLADTFLLQSLGIPLAVL